MNWRFCLKIITNVSIFESIFELIRDKIKNLNRKWTKIESEKCQNIPQKSVGVESFVDEWLKIWKKYIISESLINAKK